MGSEIVTRADKFDKLKAQLTNKKAMEQLALALPKHITPEKMARVALTAMIRTPKLMDCTRESLMDAVMQASQLGLLPDGVLGHGYILPYKDRAVFIPGYKGLIDLARRSGEIAWLQARPVYEGDFFSYSYGMGNLLNHVPARAEGKAPGKLIAAYAVAKFKTGEFQFEVMYIDQIDEVRKRARAKDDGPWVTDYEQMCLKTVIRRLCKYLPLNPEHQALVARDEYAEVGALEHVLDLPLEELTPIDVEAKRIDPLEVLAEEMERSREKSSSEDSSDAPDEPEEAPPVVGEVLAPQEESDAQLPFAEAKGKISRNEDVNFIAAIENLKEKMRKVQSEELIEKVVANRCGVYGAEKPLEIRSRLDREKFYKDLKEMLEGWEGLARMNHER